VAAGPAETALGADLSKIDRTIKKEPVYQGKPKYCLLVLGPGAGTRVWLVQDGNTLYIDRNSNGDLTEPGKKAAWTGQSCNAGPITGPDGKPQADVRLRRYPSGIRLLVRAEGKRNYVVGDPDGDALVFADRPGGAPVVHIGGPLAIDLAYYGRVRGTFGLRLRVGTPGLGKGALAAVILPHVVPVAEIEFPSSKPGGPPIVIKVPLTDR
jgi:hypothetical protein